MNRHSPEFKALVKRLQAGELTRKDAAEQAGLSYGTLSVWLSRSGVTAAIPDNRRTNHADKPFEPHAAVLNGAEMTPDKAKALNAAVDKVLAGGTSARAAAAEMGVSHVTVAAKVRKIRIAQGLPVQARTSPGPRTK